MSVALVIQAHPRRRELAEALALDVGGIIVYDPMPRAKWPSPWRTYRECLRAGLDAGADHVLVVQDDAQPCRGFRGLAENALELRPLDVVAFFVGDQNPQNAIAMHIAHDHARAWCELDRHDWIPLVATAWPRALAAELLEFGLARYADPVADDMVAGRFMTTRMLSYLAVVPSPVEHGDAPSLLGSRLERRAVLHADDAAVYDLAAF